MPTIEELRRAAGDLDVALTRWEASGFSDDDALQKAVVDHMRLAPVFQVIYGNVPLLVTQYPPYIVMKRERDHLAQAIGALDGGLITQQLIDQVTEPNDESRQEALDGLGNVDSPLDELIREGESLTYPNFARRDNRGFPNELSAEWVSWTARVEEAVMPLLRPGSSAYTQLQEGLSWPFLGK